MPLGPRSVVFVLTAVFLALGLGVLIGGTVPADRLWLEGQQKLLVALEAEFTTLRTRTRAYEDDLAVLRAESERQQRLVEALAPLAVANRLTDEAVALIALGAPTAGAMDVAARLGQLLDRAGAAPIWSVAVSAEGLPDDHTAFTFAGLLTAVAAGSADQLAQWQDGGLLTVTGEPVPVHALAVVHVGPAGGLQPAVAEEVGPWFGDTAAAAGLPETWPSTVPPAPSLYPSSVPTAPRLVGGIVSGVEPGFSRQWRQAGLSTVTGIEGVAGQVALVLQLAGESPGFLLGQLP